MTQRDRTVLMVVGVLAVFGAFFFLAIKPKRADLKDLDAQVAVTQTRLDTANAAVSAAQKAKAGYQQDYATVARLGKAVPQDDDTASLIYQLQAASDRASVDFRSLQLVSSGAAVAAPPSTTAGQVAALGAAEKGTTATTPGATTTPTTSTPATGTPAPAAAAAPVAATQTAAAGLPPGAAVGAAGFPTMPFDFKFVGRFFRLEKFLNELDKFTRVAKDGSVTVRGRLLTVDGFTLEAAPAGFPAMTAQVHATAYMLPQDQAVTAGATPTAPAGAGTATATATTTNTATGTGAAR